MTSATSAAPDGQGAILRIERRGGIAIVTLARPGALNALSRALRAALAAVFRALEADPAIQVMILTGEGRAFSAGLDLKELATTGLVDQPLGMADDPVAALADFTGPVIAAINGFAVTGGLELALACDVLLASASARFADTHVKLGVMPGWGLSQRLSRAIGPYRAREPSLTGRYLSAREADEWGLVNRVVDDADLMPQALAMAEAMLATSPGMPAKLKALMVAGDALPLGEALALEQDLAAVHNDAVGAEQIEGRLPSL